MEACRRVGRSREANLTLVANPNSPTGTQVSIEALEALAKQLQGPLVIDEAYVDFAPANALSWFACPK